MDQANLMRPFVHAGDEAHQSVLPGMRRIATERVNLCPNLVALTVELDVAASRTELQYLRPGRAARLVTDEHDVMRVSASMAFR